MAKVVVGLSGGVDSSYVLAMSDVQTVNSCGYKEERLHELFKDTDIQFISNQEYDNTNMVYTLMCAEELFEKEDDIIVTYGDIIYTPQVFQTLLASNEELSVIDYRLKSIEEELKGLKELLVTVPILNNELENLEHRLSTCETNVDIAMKEISNLKAEPVKQNAEKWKYITDYIFKSVVAVVIGYFLFKVGLK